MSITNISSSISQDEINNMLWKAFDTFRGIVLPIGQGETSDCSKAIEFMQESKP